MSDQPTTKTVYHPDFPDHTREVPKADADAWKDAGWRLSAPAKKADADKPAAKPANDPNVTVAQG